eukprot:XP_005638753.1 LOW QUALITY PROTEIN: C2 calcium-dependent domain-containing protein 4B [Canis lupus familiaris]
MRLLGRLRPAPAEPACSHVLTPARIPEFCIPPRRLPPCAPESPPPAAALPGRCAAEPDLWPRGADAAAGHTDWDPRSQAALSLPHLPRGRTASGFCALLESPHTRRQESLFLGGPGRLEADGTVAMCRSGGALCLTAEYSRASGRLRVRLLGAEDRAAGAGGAAGAAGAAEPRAVGCRVSFVLRPPGQTRPRRSAVVRPSRAAASEQDVWLDGLSEEQLRRLAVRVQAEERGRLRGQGELLLGALLLPAGPGLRPPPRA